MIKREFGSFKCPNYGKILREVKILKSDKLRFDWFYCPLCSRAGIKFPWHPHIRDHPRKLAAAKRFDRIAAYVALNPGCGNSQIEEALDLPAGTVKYYLPRFRVRHQGRENKIFIKTG